MSLIGPRPSSQSDDAASLADIALLRATSAPDYNAGKQPLRFVDLFCGCGALSLGVLEAARALGRSATCALAVDLDRRATAVYAASLNTRTTRTANLAVLVDGKLRARRTSSELRLIEQLQDVDVLVAGPPCQGHSALNNHSRHDDDRNDLYLRVARFAALAEPTLIIIENVASITRDRRRSAERARACLESLGYRTDESLIDLNRLGVPQLRRRHVLIATRDVPAPDVDRTVDQYAVPEPWARSVGWAIGDLEQFHAEAFDSPSQPTAENQERIDWLHGQDAYDLPNPRRPICHRDDKHTYKSMYGRLWWDRPAQTITSGYGSMGQGRYVHPRARRTLTPHEAARLQFIPDFFDFVVVAGRGTWAQMIGNAAPMKLSYAFALEALR